MIWLFSFVFYTVLIVVSSEENVLNSTNIILVVGKTSSEKSTLIQYVAGDSSKLISNKSSNTNNLDYEIQYELKPENSAITWSTVLQTVVPEPMIDGEQNVWYDCPSFAEINNEVIAEIANTVFIKHAIDTASNVKIVMVVDYEFVERGQIHRDFDDLLSDVTRLIKNFKHYENSLSMVVTKVPSFYTRNREIIQISEENVKNTTAEFMLKYRLDLLQNGMSNEKVLLIDTLLKQSEEETYPKLSVFWKPDDVGRLSEIEKFVKGRELIRKSILENTAYAQIKSEDFDFPLSDKAILYISYMEYQAIESFNSQLTNISDQVKNGVNQTIQSLHYFDEMLKKIHMGKSKLEYYKNIDEFNLKNLTQLFGELVKEFDLSFIKEHALLQIEREENYLNVLKSIVNGIKCYEWVSGNFPERIDYKSLFMEISVFFKKYETEIKNNTEVEIPQIINNISVALSNADQQLLVALQEKLEERSDIRDKFNLLRIANESIGNVSTLEPRIKQFSTLIRNLNITSINISALNQIEEDHLYLNELVSISKFQVDIPVEEWITNSLNVIKFIQKCESDIQSDIAFKIKQTINNIYFAVSSADQQLLAALHEKFDERNDIRHKFNVLRIARESIKSIAHVSTLEPRIEQFSTLIRNLNITSMKISDLNQIKQDRLYLKELKALSKSQIIIPDEIWIANSSSAVNFVSSKYLCYKDATDMLNLYKTNEETPLHRAALFGKMCAADLFIKHGVNVNAQGSLDWTPLHEAALSGYEDVTELLIKRGAFVNAPNKYRQTPLYYAAEKGHTKVVEVLIRHGAQIDTKNYFGKTPLDLATEDVKSTIRRLQKLGY